MASSAARTPRSRGTEAGSTPSTSSRPPRATITADGLRPTNDQRLHRSRSTDSNRKPGPSPTTRRKAATGVVRSASSSCHTGTTEWVRARARNSSLLGCTISGAVGAEGPVEARVLPRVTGARAFLLDDEQDDVAVAVVVRLADPLAVARAVALAPHLLARPAPEHRPPRLE